MDDRSESTGVALLEGCYSKCRNLLAAPLPIRTTATIHQKNRLLCMAAPRVPSQSATTALQVASVLFVLQSLLSHVPSIWHCWLQVLAGLPALLGISLKLSEFDLWHSPRMQQSYAAQLPALAAAMGRTAAAAGRQPPLLLVKGLYGWTALLPAKSPRWAIWHRSAQSTMRPYPRAGAAARSAIALK